MTRFDLGEDTSTDIGANMNVLYAYSGSVGVKANRANKEADIVRDNTAAPRDDEMSRQLHKTAHCTKMDFILDTVTSSESEPMSQRAKH